MDFLALALYVPVFAPEVVEDVAVVAFEAARYVPEVVDCFWVDPEVLFDVEVWVGWNVVWARYWLWAAFFSRADLMM